MCKLLALPLVAALSLGAYNLSTGHDLFHLPGARTIANTVRETVGDTVRDGVRSAARETGAEVRDRASAGVQVAVNRTEGAVTAAALTSKIKAKMALDDVVNANEIDVDTEGSVVTLTGDVGSRDEQRRAVRIATETKGVTKFVN
jgi:osmotically-inducible protein OsmY